jgi:hypothetical protein
LQSFSRQSSSSDLGDVSSEASSKLCFFAPVGTKGDLLPLLNGAVDIVAADDLDAVFLSQPCFADIIKERMSRSSRFKQCNDAQFQQFTWRCNKYVVSHSPELMIERESTGRQKMTYSMEKIVFRSDGCGRLVFLWAKPAKGSCDETDYQTPFSVDAGWSPVNYGEFLSNWQGYLGFVQRSELAGNAKFVTSHFERPSNVAKLEEAMGIRSSLVVRLGSLCLTDPHAHQPEQQNQNYHYAISSTLAPKEIPFNSHMVFPHPAIEKCGVLGQQPHIFESHPVPEHVVAFLDRMPTAVVTISSFGQVKHVVEMFPASDKFQVLFLSSSCQSDADPNHMHYEGLLDLDKVFQRAALIVHGCGVGTVHQVALSATPSIGLSGFLEQECNGKALEKLGISKHFSLKLLYTDHGSIEAFIETVLACIDGTASFVNPRRLREVQSMVQKEHDEAFGTFFGKVRKMLQQE